MIEHKGLFIRENTYDKEIINEIKGLMNGCPS